MNFLGTVKLESDRLVLRRFTKDDSKEIFEGFRNQPEFLFYTNKEKISLEMQEKSLEKIDEKYENLEYFNWLITLKETGSIIGAINLRVNSKNDSVMFNYAIDNRFTGKGFMTEALMLVKDFCFSKLEVVRFEGGCASQNIASKRVMEKCGLQFEGTLKSYIKLSNGYHDMLMFAEINPVTRRKSWKKITQNF